MLGNKCRKKDQTRMLENTRGKYLLGILVVEIVQSLESLSIKVDFLVVLNND